MNVLRKYEIDVISLLVGDALSHTQLNKLLLLERIDEYRYTGSGYFLTLTHSALPEQKLTLSSPFIIGEANGIRCGFIAFLENEKFILECHSLGEIDVPENFRDMDVWISIKDMKINVNFQ